MPQRQRAQKGGQAVPQRVQLCRGGNATTVVDEHRDAHWPRRATTHRHDVEIDVVLPQREVGRSQVGDSPPRLIQHLDEHVLQLLR